MEPGLSTFFYVSVVKLYIQMVRTSTRTTRTTQPKLACMRIPCPHEHNTIEADMYVKKKVKSS